MITIEILFLASWLCLMFSSKKKIKETATLVEILAVIFFICYSSSEILFVVFLILNVLLLIWQIIRDLKKS